MRESDDGDRFQRGRFPPRLRNKMKGTQKTQDKVRITVDLSPEFYARLESLTAFIGAESKAQVVREALRLYEYVVHRYLAGDEFLSRTKDGVEKTIVLLGSTPIPA